MSKKVSGSTPEGVRARLVLTKTFRACIYLYERASKDLPEEGELKEEVLKKALALLAELFIPERFATVLSRASYDERGKEERRAKLLDTYNDAQAAYLKWGEENSSTMDEKGWKSFVQMAKKAILLESLLINGEKLIKYHTSPAQ